MEDNIPVWLSEAIKSHGWRLEGHAIVNATPYVVPEGVAMCEEGSPEPPHSAGKECPEKDSLRFRGPEHPSEFQG